MKHLVHFTISILAIGLILAACAPVARPTSVVDAPTGGQSSTRPAPVESVQIQILDRSPVQVNALVRGHLTESCATLGNAQVTYTSNVFQIAVVAVSPGDRGCAQVVTPFETTIALSDHSEVLAGTRNG